MASIRELEEKVTALERENAQLNHSIDDYQQGEAFMEKELERQDKWISRLHTDKYQLEAENTHLKEENKLMKDVVSAALTVLEETKLEEGSLVREGWSITALFTAVINSGKVLTGKLARRIWLLEEGEGLAEPGWRAQYYGEARNFV